MANRHEYERNNVTTHFFHYQGIKTFPPTQLYIRGLETLEGALAGMENMPLEETLLHSKALHYKYCIGNNNKHIMEYRRRVVVVGGRKKCCPPRAVIYHCSLVSLFKRFLSSRLLWARVSAYLINCVIVCQSNHHHPQLLLHALWLA